MNEMFKILIAVDFSEASLEAVRWAAALSRRIESEVTLLSVIERPRELVPEPFWDEEGLQRDRLSGVSIREKFGHRPVSLEVRAGDVEREILLAAEQRRSDLIVMGTHGRRGLMRAMLGSVAEGVMRRAPCPVVAVRDGLHAGPEGFREPDEARAAISSPEK